ncbi:glycosyltransferase family 2 protein [Paenibacillus gorillae]|uniref:glycosyltransferase family 2 protein n=1 Tax=Paenibacillus gorillae TaxID=1243662 RepID=UPI0004AD9727|nr:glycosyltransferase [Paenibacillus gorillae]
MSIQLSICICTRNRPEDLEKALISIEQSTIPAFEVIVSDDSTDLRTRDLVASKFPQTVFIEGPRKGLGPNRNHVLQRAAGTHLLFMDDDMELGTECIERLNRRLNQVEAARRDKAILTGIEYGRNNDKVYPKDQSFLGYQTKLYNRSEGLNTLVIGSAIFPRGLFQMVRFDEQLVYGYDEVDISTRAVKSGYEIILCEQAFITHNSSPVNRDYYKPVIEASRFYVTYKRYTYTEKLPVKGWIFFSLACCHLLLSDLKHKGLPGLKDARKTMETSLTYIRNYRQTEAGR